MKRYSEGFEKHLAKRPAGISPLTISTYLTAVRKFQAWYVEESGGPLRLKHVLPQDLRDYKIYMQKKAKYKPPTINKHLAGLRSFFDWGIQEELFNGSDNPVKVANLPQPRSLPRSLDIMSEWRPFRRAVQRYGSKRDIAIIMLFRHAGLRVSELCSLTLADVELSPRKGVVTVRYGKGGSYREVELNKPARKALKNYLAERPQTDAPNLFIGKRGALSRFGVWYIIDKYRKLAGLEEATPHMLRHTLGRTLADQGTDLTTIADILGHTNISSTARYTRSSSLDRAKALERQAYEE